MINIENFKILRAAVEQAPVCDMHNATNCLFGICGRLPEFAMSYPPSTGMKIDICSWLGLTMQEGWALYSSYPRVAPSQGWRQWMLARLDRIMESGRVGMEWTDQTQVVNWLTGVVTISVHRAEPESVAEEAESVEELVAV